MLQEPSSVSLAVKRGWGMNVAVTSQGPGGMTGCDGGCGQPTRSQDLEESINGAHSRLNTYTHPSRYYLLFAIKALYTQ